MRPVQATLARSTAWILGPPLDQAGQAEVRFHPSAADSGLTFVRSDLPGEPRVSCNLSNLRAQARWTSLEQDGVWVHHTEHVLAALAGAGLDNVVIELKGDRLPVVTAGSCAGFLGALQQAGFVEQPAPRRVFRLRQPVYQTRPLATPSGQDPALEQAARRYIAGLPADTFAVTYVFHVPHLVGLPIGLAEYDVEVDEFADGLGAARTYFLETEQTQVNNLLNEVRQAFILLTASSPAALVHEVARHKAMDFLGDLMVLGRLVLGRFFAFRSGHRLHHQLAHWLVQSDSLELTSLA
jgi:UDP-3-O-acyl-N-acetylglucosamine deacetylase